MLAITYNGCRYVALRKISTNLKIEQMIKFIRNLFKGRKQQCNIPVVSGSCEQPQDNNGDLVPLVWMIEKLRRREGGCTMNELVAEAKRNFKGIEQIKHRTINYR